MNKSLFIMTILAVGVVFEASAQRIEGFVGNLASPSGEQMAKVSITHHGDVANILLSIQQQNTDAHIKGYRVRVFFDNSQSAREAAYATMSRFSEMFPETPAYMIYENPYFKVSVGNCLTNEEAITLWGKVKQTFDRAFVIREDIPISALGE